MLAWLLNLGFAASGVAGPTFNPAWAATPSRVIGPASKQPTE